MKVLIAHAEGEVEQAEKLAQPIEEAGYEPVHYGAILVGESLTEEASKVLNSNGPLVLCGTPMAVGTGFAYRLVNATRSSGCAVRIFPVRMEQSAYLQALALDGKIAEYWQNPTQAVQELIASLQKHFPLHADAQQVIRQYDLEARYRELALKSCDIIDLANLPEDDRHLAARELELRRLYVALRLRKEVGCEEEADDNTLKAVEKRRSCSWGSAERYYGKEEESVSLGERLRVAQQLVVLGDPGAGKSTLLRWLATAYLLRLQQQPDWRDLPDIASLPETNWLPVLIRCRDLPAEATHTLETMLQHSLRKSEVPEKDCAGLCDLLCGKLKRGEALLLIDGLDEMTEPTARARLAQQVEQIHRVYAQAPIVVTSRIVGYREMGYRIRSGFEHLTVVDLSKEDKDDFVSRWCGLTERPERREAAAKELIDDIHSSDRIERLTGNPMLLTTMALIKRKIGKLPQRRVELYEKAVEVLLNWRSEVDTPLDHREAEPQLYYLAHTMCKDGVQQLHEEQVLALLRQMREEYPHIHSLQQHSPEEFLRLLERRTGLLIQSGHTRHNGRSVPVYEFRHLTFQEYLAGIALVQGCYQGRDKRKSLAEVIAPLAGEVEEVEQLFVNEISIKENWREALRLCLAACNNDDVDAALLAILHPLPDEEETARARAVQAAFCLADEPNVSEKVAQEVLRGLVAQVPENEFTTHLENAVTELAASRWAALLGEYLLDEFFRRDGEAWALGWINDDEWNQERVWHPTPQQLEQLLAVAAKPNCDKGTLSCLSRIFGREKLLQAVDILLSHLPANQNQTWYFIMEALGNIGGEKAWAALKEYLQDQDKDTRRVALGGIAQTCKNEIDRRLLTEDLYGIGPGLDPQAPITTDRIAQAAKRLKQPVEKIAQRYVKLAKRFGLTLEPEVLAAAQEKMTVQAEKKVQQQGKVIQKRKKMTK
jgi:GTPase SAR1 family protein